MNNDNQLIYSTRTEQIAARRDEAMQKFEQGMRLIAEASALAEISLFHPDIMKPNIFGPVGAKLQNATSGFNDLYQKRFVQYLTLRQAGPLHC